MNRLSEMLAVNDVLLTDGAMGTELFARGLISGDPPEGWNVDHPDRVADVHRMYAEAGSDIVLTNTFGGTSFRLSLHKWEHRVGELNAAGARVARGVVDEAGRPMLVAGSMGPTGELLEPMGAMTNATARQAFAEQARGLADGGADVLWIETMSDLDEVEMAFEGARSVCDLPIVATMSYDTAGRTMMGVTGEVAASRLSQIGLAAIGANCGNNIAQTEAAVRELRTHAPDTPIISKANAGIPVWEGAGLSYSGTPEVMGAHAHRMSEAGVRIIGACCGSGPAHVEMMRQVLSGTIDVPVVDTPAAPDTTGGEAPQRKRSSTRRRRTDADG